MRAPAPESIQERLQMLLGADVTVESEIGRGAMGAVYAGFDTGLQRRVAIKALLPEAASDSGIADRFIREARVAAALDHPNVVSIYSVRQGDDIRAIVMQRIEGRGLDKVLWETPLLPVPVAALMLAQVANALQHAHDRGVIHRDIKPANILLGDDGLAVVTDFGIARKLGATRITEEGLIVGTLGYISPEACSGQEPTARADQYSLGVVAFELFVGRRPFTGSPIDLLRLQTTTDAPSIAEARPDLPVSLAKTVQRMLEREPDARWPSLREVERALRAVVADPENATREMRTLSAAPPQLTSRVMPATVAAARKKVAERKAGPDTKARPVRSDPATKRGTMPMFAAAGTVAVVALSAGMWFSRDRTTSTDATMEPIRAETTQSAAQAPARDRQTAERPSPEPAPPAGGTENETPASRTGTDRQTADDTATRADSTPPAIDKAIVTLPPRRESTLVIPPVRREPVTPPPRPALPASTASDARRVGNAFVTLINQGRWRELESLDRTGGDASARDGLVGLIRDTRGIAAGFDRLPSAPFTGEAGFDTEFIVELVLGSGANASRTYVTVTARAAHDGAAWVLAGWRVERTP